jgi:hypothetical protein
MFLDNRYAQWYHALMAKRRMTPVEGYGEWHHVVPRSLGGSNAKANLVRLSAREHFIAHRLLVRMTVGDARRRMSFALHATARMGEHKITSRQAEVIREAHAAELRGRPRDAETKRKISEALRGREVPAEVRAKMSATTRGRKKSAEWVAASAERMRDPVRDAKRRDAISAALTGRPRSEETRRKISDTIRRNAERRARGET